MNTGVPERTKPELLELRLCAFGRWGISPWPGSEINFEVCLSLSWIVVLTSIPIVNHSKVTAVYVGLRPADLHPVEHVEEFHPQLSRELFTKIEVLSQRNIFVGAEGIAQITDPPGRIAENPRPWAGKSLGIENGQSLVIVIVIDVEGHARDKISDITCA